MNILDPVIEDKSRVTLSDVFLNEENKNTIVQLIREHHYMDTLLSYSLPVSNKILLSVLPAQGRLRYAGTNKSRSLIMITCCHRSPVHLQDIRRQYDISFAEAKDHTFTSAKAKLISKPESKLPPVSSTGTPHLPS